MSGTSDSGPSQISAASSSPTSASYPPCAGQCLSNATTSLPCEASDSACLCLHASTVQKSVAACLAESNACPPAAATAAENYYDTLCASLQLPTTTINPAATEAIVTATGSPTGIPSNFITATPTSTSSATPSHSSSNPLNVPTIAGIAAGVAFILAAIITGLIYMYIRRQHSPPSYTDSEKTAKALPRDPPTSSAVLTGDQKRKSSTASTLSSASTASRGQKKHPRYSSRHISLSSTKDLETTVTTRALPSSDSGTTLASPYSKFNHKRSSENPLTQPSIPHPRPDSPLAKARFAFGAKRAAEASVTSLTLPVPGRRISVAAHSPAATEFSDIGSVDSVATTAESESLAPITTSKAYRPFSSSSSTYQPSAHQHSHHGSISEVSSLASLEIESWKIGSSSGGRGQPLQEQQQRQQDNRIMTASSAIMINKPNIVPEVKSLGTRPALYQHPGASLESTTSSIKSISKPKKPQPLTITTANTMPTTTMRDINDPTAVDIDERRKSLIRLNPLGQNPSPHPDQTNFKFDFDLPSPVSMQDFRRSMMGSLNFDFEDEARQADKRKSLTVR